MNNIKQIRKQNNISVSKLAQMVGMSQANLTKIENNQVELKIELATQIAEALNTSLENILNTKKYDTLSIKLLNPEVYNLPNDYMWQIAPLKINTLNTNLKGYIIPDDTMAPLFPKHSIAILDANQNTLENAVFLIERRGELMLRRLQKMPLNTLSILTENKSYQQENITLNEIKIIAKAISVISQINL